MFDRLCLVNSSTAQFHHLKLSQTRNLPCLIGYWYFLCYYIDVLFYCCIFAFVFMYFSIFVILSNHLLFLAPTLSLLHLPPLAFQPSLNCSLDWIKDKGMAHFEIFLSMFYLFSTSLKLISSAFLSAAITILDNFRLVTEYMYFTVWGSHWKTTGSVSCVK